jgi:hypothetical protein
MLNRRISVIAFVVTLIICGVVLTALVSLYELADKLAGTSAIVFLVINLLVLLAMVLFGKTVSADKSFAVSAQAWSVTIIYSVVQFITLFLMVNRWSNLAYTLFQLVLLALWFGIAGAAITIGKRDHRKEDNLL